MHEVRIEVLQRQVHGPPVRSASRTIARDTRSRGARSPAGSYRAMNASPSAFRSRAPSPRSASDSRKRGWPGHVQRRRMKLDELEIGDRARRRDTPSRRRRRSRPAGSSSRDRPARRRRSRAAPRAPAPPPSVPSSARNRAPDAAAVLDDQLDDARVIVGRHAGQRRRRAPRARGRSRGRSHRARAARGARCAPLRSPAPARRRRRDRTARPTPSARGRSAGRLRRATRTARSSHRPSPAAMVSARVQLGRVAGADRRGDAALGVAGVALARLGLGEDEDVAGAGELGGRAQRRDAAADDEEVRAKVHAVPDAVILPSPPTMSSPPARRRRDPVRLDVRTSSRPLHHRDRAGVVAPAARRCSTRAGVPARRFVVSSPTVWRFHGERLQRRHRRRADPDPRRRALQAPATVGRIYDALIRADADRASAIVAIGGGVVGDIAGLRRRDLPARRPGRAGADDAAGAGGQRHRRQGRRQPSARQEPDRRVSSSRSRWSSIPLLLATLPRREFRAGLYEVVKYGVIASRAAVRSRGRAICRRSSRASRGAAAGRRRVLPHQGDDRRAGRTRDRACGAR